MKGPYDDIISLPHHVSAVHAPMPAADRAAQFAPFAALTGYEAAIRESGRLTARRLELTDEEKELLNRKLLRAAEGGDHIAITYFLPDRYKAGGSYVTAVGRIKKVDRIEGSVIFLDGMKIPVEEIAAIGEPEQ